MKRQSVDTFRSTCFLRTLTIITFIFALLTPVAFSSTSWAGTIGCSSDEECDDGQFCNGPEQCVGGACLVSPGLIPCQFNADQCIDKLVCNEDTDMCDPVFVEDGTPCDDGQFCTGVDICVGGECIGGIPPCESDGNPCTFDCDEDNDDCTPVPVENGTPCNDDFFCNGEETCQEGICEPGKSVSCLQTKDPCEFTSCDEETKGCITKDAVSGTPCDDGMVCTLVDECDGAGNCVGMGLNGCKDDRECTADSCDAENNACVNDPSGCECEFDWDCDGCLGETCNEEGKCVSGEPVDCSDENPCTQESCVDGSSSELLYFCVTDSLIGESCNTDENLCTPGICCIPGNEGPICGEMPKPALEKNNQLEAQAQVPAEVFCLDGETVEPITCTPPYACATSACDPASGECIDNVSGCNCETDEDCEDGNPCTASVCEKGPILKGAGEEGTGLGVCSEQMVLSGEACEDGSPCTQGDMCNEAGACVGSPKTCDDGDTCTQDSCREDDGECLFTEIPGCRVPEDSGGGQETDDGQPLTDILVQGGCKGFSSLHGVYYVPMSAQWFHLGWFLLAGGFYFLRRNRR